MKVYTRLLSLILAMVLLFSAVPVTGFAAEDEILGIAFVDASSLRLRKEASTTSKIVDTAYRDEVVVVLSKHDDWYKVSYDLQEGYMSADYLDLLTTENVELGYGKITGYTVNLRSGASTSKSVIAEGTRGDKVYIIGVRSGWYKVIFGEKICYIRSDFVELTEVPYENRASKHSPRFFEGGKSTGVKPSASALKEQAATKPAEPEETKPAETKPSTGSSSQSASTTVNTNSDIKYGVAFVDATSLRLRSEASTGSKTIDTAKNGEVVVVLSKHGEWYKVIYDLQEGYMHEDYLKVRTTENVELGYGKVSGSSVNLRSGPSTSYKFVSVASKGSKAYIVGISDGWYKVIYGTKVCYIRSDYLQLTEVPYENRSSSNSPKFFKGGKSTGVSVSAGALNGTTGSSSDKESASSGTGSQDTGSVSGSQIVATAKKYLGTPYKWGGTTSSGFDCSGFVYYVLRSNGIKASRTIATMYKQGTPVKKSELKPGDIVFFQGTYKSGLSHVGIYVGDGKFIHSPHSGEVVSYANLYSDYYVNHYYGACRMS